MRNVRILLVFSLVLPACASFCPRPSWCVEDAGEAVELPRKMEDSEHRLDLARLRVRLIELEKEVSQGATKSSTGPIYVNSLDMRFVPIPAGTFRMGCSPEAEECDDDERPRQEVTISRPFYLGEHEVTQAQWEAVMGSNPSRFKGPDRPVENVGWHDVQEFIRKLNGKEGHARYRLPTEAEWEYAARAGSATTYHFGNDAGRLGDHAWYDGNSGDETHPVGRKDANAWGLHDMHGNVWEWVADWYGAKYYRTGAAVDPAGPASGAERVMRGGSWLSVARYCRSAHRGKVTPDSRHGFIGFRLALTPEHRDP